MQPGDAVLYAVLADIHGNLQALSAVLDDVERTGADKVLCVGDIVGYGAHPKQCLDAMRELSSVTVAGNHDWGAVDKVDIDYFNADARDSIEWTREQLGPDERQYLQGLNLVETLGDLALVHSSFFAPEYFDYIQTVYDVQLNFRHLQMPVGFVGHSHVPAMFATDRPSECFLQEELQLSDGTRAIINVGSVGQPRDLDPRASYALYDVEAHKVTMRRVEYDVQAAFQEILNAGLPTTNAHRLLIGR